MADLKSGTGSGRVGAVASLRADIAALDRAQRDLSRETRGNDVVVMATRIIGTDHVVFDAWEPTSGYTGPHSSLFTINGHLYGRIGTRRPPPELEALPGYDPHVPESGRERQTRVGAWYEAQYERAYEAILREWPEVGTHLSTKNAHKSMGEISVWSRHLADVVEPRPAWRSKP